MTHYIVQTAWAKMPGSVKAPYRRVAVIEVTSPDVVPAMISQRARGVVLVVETWERCNVGFGKRSAYARALMAANALAAKLNGQPGDVR